MQFPIINISEKLFQKNNEFIVFESDKIRSNYLEISSNYLNKTFIDSNGRRHVLTKFKNVDPEKNVIKGSVYWWPIEWLLYGIEKYIHRKKIDYLYQLIFEPLEDFVGLEEIKVIVLAKISDYHFIEDDIDINSFISEINKCNDYKKVFNLISEE